MKAALLAAKAAARERAIADFPRGGGLLGATARALVADQAANAVTMRTLSRQKLPPEERRQHLDITLAPATVADVRAMAEARRTNVSALIETLIMAEVERMKRRAAK